MRKLKHGSLFSGIGGFDLAAQRAGWENIFHCEWNPFGRRVLNYYWSKAGSYEDITKTDFKKYRGHIDVLTGGFPCQPFSVAGARGGSEDDRYLWPEMLRAIEEIKPTWVVGENVTGIVTMVQPGEITSMESQANLFEEDYSVLEYEQEFVIETICSDLESIGYSVQPIIIPACAVNAPHRRDRVWFIANSSSQRCNNRGNHRQERHFQDNINRYAPKDKSEWNEWKCGARPFGQITTNSNYKGLQRSEIKGSVGESKQNSNKLATRLFQSRWKEFPTQPPVCNGDDGIPPRLDGITFSKWREESIKAGGNAIVPQVAEEMFQMINEIKKPCDTNHRGKLTKTKKM